MGDFVSNIPVKFFSFITAIIFLLSPFGAPEILDGFELSTVLTQREIVKGTLPKEKELELFDENSEKGFIIPGLYEGFIPQGIFFEESNEVFLISGYYKDKTLPSRIILVNKDGEFIKSVGAESQKGNKAYGHFGGIAVYKNWVYVATTTVTHVLSLSDILNAPDDGYCKIKKELYTDTTCSFVNVCAGILYIGEYTDKTFTDIKEATNIYSYKGQKFYSRCNAFVLDENSPWGIQREKIDEKGNLTPDFAFGIPFKAQGFAVLNDGRVVVTASSTAITNSNIYIYSDARNEKPEMEIESAGAKIPLYLLLKEDKIRTVKAPTYLEEVALYSDSSVYLITESAAAPYKRQSKNPTDRVLKFDISKIK